MKYKIIGQPSLHSSMKEIKKWLFSEVGNEYIEWAWTLHFPAHSFAYDKFEFKHEEDKIKFILRWM